ncbi:ABC transporter ATP-binding protein [Halopiger goleimassiliensis]|uniref:ABC transporter ATP-binding protein n=1 Tax=Halopiger goleimassiliensis TaxID=1293048 RepID=UPI000677BCCC|nr:ABC transporter ATP-binding protein [Halopiger goleimassiliensis]
MTALTTTDLTKRYGSTTAIDSVSLTVDSGTVFGLLGPNGAGKSTLIDLLLDFVRPDAGTATVLGLDPRTDAVEIRRRTGVLPDGFAAYPHLTGEEHLAFTIEMHDADDDPAALLERVGLADAASRPAAEYSTGMTQRLGLAMALVGDPDLLVLDEPSAGLDPNGVTRLREIVRTERERGATVVFSSHVLPQVEAVCDDVAIVDDGRLVAEGPLEELRAGTGDATRLTVRVTAPPPSTALEAVRALPAVDAASANEETLEVSLTDSAGRTPVLTTLDDHGVDVVDFETESNTLADVFAHHVTE